MNRMTTQKLKYNTISSVLHQVIAVICGFIVPRAIIGAFGSEVNGLVNSIAQFLQVIAFLDLGVGTVVQTALYKPLTMQDSEQISRVITSAERFFRKIAYILLAYTFFLICFFNKLNSSDFSWGYTATLIAAMSISFFSQYYFGIVDRLLLTADQKVYIYYIAQMATLLLNALSCVVLIHVGASIQIVRLVSSLVFLLRPVVLRLYVNKRYSIDRRIKYEGEPIDQKWNGIAQHVAFTVLDSTDIIVLTLLSTLSNVSIYSVYHLVVYGVKQLFVSLTDGVQPIMGELYAKQEMDKLNDFFSKVEWLIHAGTVLIFGCTGALILQFVSVYTNGVHDAEYIQPLFAVLIVLAHGCHCLRLPYNIIIFASRHFKKTQNNYFISTAINIVVSVITVRIWGLVGVAIGTLAAMAFQTIWMAWYNSKNILKRPLIFFIKQIFVDAISICILWMGPFHFELSAINYISWGIEAVKCFLLYTLIIFFINIIFYRENVRFCIGKVLKSKEKQIELD